MYITTLLFKNVELFQLCKLEQQQQTLAPQGVRTVRRGGGGGGGGRGGGEKRGCKDKGVGGNDAGGNVGDTCWRYSFILLLEMAVEMAMGGKWPYGYEGWGWPQ